MENIKKRINHIIAMKLHNVIYPTISKGITLKLREKIRTETHGKINMVSTKIKILFRFK
jgi:hypothetical protein